MKRSFKKILLAPIIVGLAAVSTGCSLGGEEVVRCKTPKVNFSEQEYVFYAKNKEVNKLDLIIKFDAKMFGLEKASELTDKQKEIFEREFLKSLKLTKEGEEGLTLNISYKDMMIIDINIDLEKASQETLNKLNLNLKDADLNVDKTIKDMESSGATCKRN